MLPQPFNINLGFCIRQKEKRNATRCHMQRSWVFMGLRWSISLSDLCKCCGQVQLKSKYLDHLAKPSFSSRSRSFHGGHLLGSIGNNCRRQMLLRQYKVIMRTLESKNLGSKFHPSTVWLYDPVQATRPFYAPGFPFVKEYFFYRAIMSVKMRCTC